MHPISGQIWEAGCGYVEQVIKCLQTERRFISGPVRAETVM